MTILHRAGSFFSCLAIVAATIAPAAAASTTLALKSSQNPSNVGDPVTFTAEVASPEGWPDGFVDIYRGPDIAATLALDPQGVLQDAKGEPQISIGANHSCAVTRAGAAVCWGANDRGQLGRGTISAEELVGGVVQGLASGVAAIGVGDVFSCALTQAGAVKCWGANHRGKLGDGGSADSSTPVQVSGLTSGVVDIEANPADTCALKDDHTLWCWGSNNDGTLGDGTSNHSNVPKQVAGLPAVASLAPSQIEAFSRCVVTTGGAVWCWGRNNVGQLGGGAPAGFHGLPVAVATLGSGVAAVSFGNAHGCALKTNGAVVCWGWNDYGQVGKGGFDTASAPTTLTALAGDTVVSVVAGGIHSCAVLANGTAKCWGSNIGFALGRGGSTSDFADLPLPVTVVSSGITAMVGGTYSSAAIRSGGRILAWGVNDHGKLGDGTTTTRPAPVVVKPLLAPSLAKLTLTDLPRGRNFMGSVYQGTVDFDGVGGGTVNQDVVGYRSVTDLYSVKTSYVFGEPVVLKAEVNGIGSAPTGTVTYKRGSTTLGTKTLNGVGLADFTTTSLPVGSSSLTAVYGGDTQTQPSTSSAWTITVAKAATTVTLVPSKTTALPGEAVTFTATVKPTVGAAVPSGSVTFKSGAKTLGSATLVGGKATVSAGFGTGVASVTAQYGGSSTFNASPLATKTVTVGAQNGVETRVNTRTTGIQSAAAIVGLDGPYAITWMSEGQDGSGYGIYGQRHAATGAKTLAEFRVNAATAQSQTFPAVASLGAGRWVAVWQSFAEDGSGAGIFGRIYAANGTAGPVFRVNASVLGDQTRPVVTGLTNGGFVVAFGSSALATTKTALFIRRFGSTGAPLAVESRVDTAVGAHADLPSIAGLTDGGFVVAWRQADAAMTVSSIRQQHYAAAGTRIGGQVIVNTDTTNFKSEPDVAGLAGGRWVVVWSSRNQDGSGYGVYGQRFQATTGARLGSETLVPTVKTNSQLQPAVAAFPGGGHVVVWASYAQDGSHYGIYMRRYDANGAPVDAVVKVNTATAGAQSDPDVATLGKRDFVVVWTSDGQDLSGGGIYAQRFRLGIDAGQPLP